MVAINKEQEKALLAHGYYKTVDYTYVKDLFITRDGGRFEMIINPYIENGDDVDISFFINDRKTQFGEDCERGNYISANQIVREIYFLASIGLRFDIGII